MVVSLVIFQSTLPARGATADNTGGGKACLFQSTLPARGATCPACTRRWTPDHFNPRSPHGERPTWCSSKLCTAEISIHAPRTGSDAVAHGWSHGRKISIHAPRTGSDWDAPGRGVRSAVISIHAPRTGSDASRVALVASCAGFQSTLPARGATRRRRAYDRCKRYFNPRSPHGEPRRRGRSGSPC